MRPKQTEHKLDGLFILLIFVLFAGSLLLVLLTGAGSYQRLVGRDAKSYERNTTLQYLAAKIHRADQADGITVGSFSEDNRLTANAVQTLHIREEFDGKGYETRIYFYDGYVRELFAEENTPLSPEDGMPIFESGGLSFLEHRGCIWVTVKAKDGEVNTLFIRLRSDQEVDA